MASSLVIILKSPDGRREQLTVDADRALVGSGAHCEVRLPVEHAAVEHLIIEARQGVIFAEARSFDPPPTVNGAPFTQGRLLSESVVKIGQVELAIALMNVTAPVESRGRSSTKLTVRAFLLALLAVVSVAYVSNRPRRGDSAMDMPTVTPALWLPQEVGCRERVEERASVLAGELLVDADGKRERSPFHPEDGVAAVTLYERAASCFQVAGQATEASRATAASEDLRKRLVDDFRFGRLRLERALATQDWKTARKVIHVLTAFLQGRSDDYVSWLSNVDRRITVKFASEKDESGGLR